ncbi:CAZyme family AA3 [Aspergillus niger]|uniref:Cholesterol oxidase n=1 Tax=Aspergillus niger TaxID=5061 RepID=A0A254TWZ2_ASPNG|nr:CAZyme family AA3 [Aspergillus niger]KAI2961062.1 CAZyme family AA3 [Aspergillus niger]KAI3023065.1 CAZyme family AA3 [Aspergillus niger]KAI3027415.1 CAZyme family AA3 [Aspergillus niger]TPR11040.1 hypothetical protein CAN33_0046725 [Aspergillus niger]
MQDGIQNAEHTVNGMNGVHDSPNGGSPYNENPSQKPQGHSANPADRGPQSQSRFPRISLPVELMQDSYDVVAIGSGYGGGVAASRMARGGQSVCILERGRERWPGEFPEKLEDAVEELHVSGQFAPGDRRSIPGAMVDAGNPNGLYHFVVGEGQNVYMGNGLGGTSLLNANVFLEAHRKVLEMGVWPEELRGHNVWKKYYDRARSVLEPAQYPSTFPKLLKADLLERQSELMSWGDNFYRVPQTTRFEDGPNSTGVYMQASQLTGMDATGINDGSKSTTLVNYLSDAWNWGAEIFCNCEVRYIAKAPDREGYIIYFAWRSCGRDRFSTFFDDLMWVHAKKFVFLGAGSIGTTEILLRSRQMGLDLSDDVGTEMSGNGDMYNTDYEANCIARPEPTPERPVGPCITSVLDLRDQRNPLDGFVVEDCAVPYALAPLMFSMLEYLPDMRRPKYSPVESVEKFVARLKGKLGPYVPEGSVQKTAVYLIMSHDSSQGRLTLQKDKPVLTYSGVGRSKSVSRIHGILERMTAAIGGNFIANPVWSTLGRQEITVHPIGGARISKDNTGNNGVVNHLGEVLKGNSSEAYEGLVVCDSSALPAAVGVNPFATITAFAERSVEMVARRRNIAIDYNTKNGQLDMFGTPAYRSPQDAETAQLAYRLAKATENQNAGVVFSEIMNGFIYTGHDVKDFEVATKLARGRCENARFFLSVKAWSAEELVKSNQHLANLTGTFTCNTLGGVFLVHRGTFQLFNYDARQPDTANLTYNFDMISTSGRKLHFNGYKVVNSASFLNPLELWRQTSTLYVTITDPGNIVVGRGMLRILPDDFGYELKTFETSGPSLWTRTRSAARFLAYFAKQLSVPFLSALGQLQWPNTTLNYASKEVSPSSTIPLKASDGVTTNMVMWNPTFQGKDILGPAPTLLFIPGAAVDHKMFALPTIERNAVEYFRESGYRIYCITHRVGRAPIAREGYTPYDARRDIHAALAHIREDVSALSPAEPPKVYVVAHCAGSLALSCGLLDGTIPSDWIQGITASMVFMNPKFGKVDSLLSRFPTSLYARLVSPYWDCTSSRNDTYIQSLLNQALRFYPQGEVGESCRSVVCHRSELVFGRLWTHKNLNDATHTQLERFLGGTSMRSLQWLMESGRKENVLANGPTFTNLVTPENLERLKGIPILFLSGTGNMVFTAENTDISYTTLCNVHGRDWYEREVFPGKGHLDAWMGSTAYQDVYPRVRRHVDQIMMWEQGPFGKINKKGML